MWSQRFGAWVGVLLLAGCGMRGSDSHPNRAPLTLCAAASTKAAVEQIARDFQAETGIPVEVLLGPSSGLAKQIEQGAVADLFLSADQASVDYLAAKQLVDRCRNLLSNRLVVVVPADSRLELKDLRDLAGPSIKRLALAEPKVPAGEYAREALANTGILEQVQGKVVGGIDVLATLQFVARGEVEAGLVYATDALGNSKVRVALEVRSELHRPIEYPLVLIRRESAHDAAPALYDYLGSEKAAAVFRRAGFGVVP